MKEELERCARIIEYDFFAPTSYNILPGFRYITDDMYHELPEEMKEILRTGSWYRRSSPEQSWPLEGVDEHMLMERDPRLEEPWKHFGDMDDYLAYEREVAERRKKGALCAVIIKPDAPGAKCGCPENGRICLEQAVSRTE
ncbi:MAG: hypothetical protein AB9903_21715 [Vulcanimicrobiota bacterium]